MSHSFPHAPLSKRSRLSTVATHADEHDPTDHPRRTLNAKFNRMSWEAGIKKKQERGVKKRPATVEDQWTLGKDTPFILVGHFTSPVGSRCTEKSPQPSLVQTRLNEGSPSSRYSPDFNDHSSSSTYSEGVVAFDHVLPDRFPTYPSESYVRLSISRRIYPTLDVH